MMSSNEGLVRAMKAEIANLKEMITRITEESEAKIASLNRQIEQMKVNPLEATKREAELTEKIIELKKTQAEESAKQNTDSQKEISELRYQIAELKNALASKEAENAGLTLENLDLKKRVDGFQEQFDVQQEEVNRYREAFESGAGGLIKNQITTHKQLIGKVNVLSGAVTQLSDKVAQLKSKVDTLHAEKEKFKFLTDRNEKAVEYMTRSLSLIAELPQVAPPSARELVEDPDALISLVSAAEDACLREKTEMKRRLLEASRSINESMERDHRPPLSQPVARVLTNLGAVMMEVNKQMSEEHKRTMRLLEGDNSSDDDLSM